MDIEALFRSKPKTNYRVKVSDGNQLRTFDVTEIDAYNDGFALRYKNGNGKQDVVYVSRQYRPLREDGYFVVGKNLGNNSGAILIDDKTVTADIASGVVGRSTDANCPGEDLSAVVRADGLSLGFKALTESNIPWKIIAIGVVAVIVVVAVVMFIKSRGG